MYRFKTRKEFEEEFGNNWMNIVDNTWNKDMDYLFGKEITHEDWNTIQTKGSFNKYWYGSTYSKQDWCVSKDMVTDKPLQNSIIPSKSLLDCHGVEFEAYWEDEQVNGKITVEEWNGKLRVYLCQNKTPGASCFEKQGYKFSYIIPSDNTIESINNCTNFNNFKLLNKSIYVKESSIAEIRRPDSSGQPRGTRIGIHSEPIYIASGCRPIGSEATNLWKGTRVAEGKVKQNFIQSY